MSQATLARSRSLYCGAEKYVPTMLFVRWCEHLQRPVFLFFLEKSGRSCSHTLAYHVAEVWSRSGTTSHEELIIGTGIMLDPRLGARRALHFVGVKSPTPPSSISHIQGLRLALNSSTQEPALSLGKTWTLNKPSTISTLPLESILLRGSFLPALMRPLELVSM